MSVRIQIQDFTRMSIADAIGRYSAAKKTKLFWDALLRETYEYFLPNRNMYYTQTQTEGQEKNSRRVFDSTAQTAIFRAANRLQSELTPPFSKWASLKAGPMMPDQLIEEANQKLYPIQNKLFGVLHASNFDTAINETYLELLIGTACILVETGDLDHPVMFIPVPMYEVSFELNAWGQVSGVFRCHKMKIRHIRERWTDIQKLPDDLENKSRDNPDAEVEIVEYTYMADNPKTMGKVAVYQLFLEDGKIDLHHRFYKRFPWVTPRWLKVAGETYGRGPAIQALPFVRVQNKIIELVLQNAALEVSGVYTYTDVGVLNPSMVGIFPGAMIQVNSNGGARGPSLQRLERGGDIGVGMELADTFAMQIKKFMLDDSLPPETAAVRSATEILARLRELARDIGSPFGRLYSELIVPLVQLTLDIMEHRGLVDPIKIDGLAVRVVVQSPLAQEQAIAEVDAIVQWLTILKEFGPEAFSIAASIEEIGAHIGEKLGVPATLIRTKQQRAQLKKAFAQAASKQLGIEGEISPIATLPGGVQQDLPRLQEAA